MIISVRNAKISDYEDISSINKYSLGYDNPPELIKKNLERVLLNQDDAVFIATANDKAVGYIHAENYNPLYSPPLKEVMSLAVMPDFQGNGIGRKLLDRVEKWAKDTGRSGIMILSQTHRTPAHIFYEACGYTLNKTQVNLIKYF